MLMHFDRIHRSHSDENDVINVHLFGSTPCGYPAHSSEAKTMKTKTWTVIANTGKQADLESGLEKKAVLSRMPGPLKRSMRCTSN
jgi:hypothetical protein